eukprot:11203509-Lingulodinium_polyedra.AAC.1
MSDRPAFAPRLQRPSSGRRGPFLERARSGSFGALLDRFWVASVVQRPPTTLSSSSRADMPAR